jgi:AcrR family transcriptional regulator
MPESDATTASEPREATRTRILEAAAELAARGGREALTTRSVAAAAGVQAPTIYRLFGDKDGLVNAVVLRGFRTYLEQKALRAPGPDPVEDLRTGWDLHVEFGLTNPALYVLMYGSPDPDRTPPVIAASRQFLAEHVARVAAAGRLRVPEHLAAELIHAAGSGTVLALLATAEDQRDPRLSELAREAVIAALTTETPAVAIPGPATAAIALRAQLPGTAGLSAAERHLLAEWLERIATTAGDPHTAATSTPTG